MMMNNAGTLPQLIRKPVLNQDQVISQVINQQIINKQDKGCPKKSIGFTSK